MDTNTWTSIGLVLLFILLGGVFAGTEIALVSLRQSQIDQLEKRGPRGERVANVARDPNRFLSAVQIGVTVAGFFSAAYGASTIAPSLAPAFVRLGMPEGAARTVALVTLTLLIAYLSLVLGELVPKRIALQRSSQLALVVGPLLDRFASLMRPVIWLLSVSTNAVVRLLGGDPHATGEEMTEEELRDLVIAHEGLPVDERRILSDVFAASERSVAEVMRPRHEVVFLSADLTLAQATEEIAAQPFSRYPVIGEDFDDVLGFVHVRDILQANAAIEGRAPSMPGADAGEFVHSSAHPPRTVRDLTRRIQMLPSTNAVLRSMTMMRRARIHIAIVIDEYGGTDGIVTLEDLVEELVGDILDEHDHDDDAQDEQAPGELVVDGGMNLEDFADEAGFELVDEGDYETVGGYVLDRLGRVAQEGDLVAAGDHVLEVLVVDSHRIEQIRVHRAASPEERASPKGVDTAES
ncbi:MAG TPA: hemolysin family protein [Beutenbergiaceae bacterium]|nr:hemolysin family protein [Beutenbergiaceae bacterium]